MNQQDMQAMMQMLANAITAGNLNITNQAQNNSTKIIPPLPDVSPFEATDDRSRITDFLERFEFALDCANPNAEDVVKVKCLMNKLSEASFAEYTKFILPKKVTDLNFADTVDNLRKLFAKPQSLWLDRYECLRATRNDNENFQSFVNRHRKLLRDFNFSALKEEQFKVLMLLTSLKSSSDATLRQRILSKLAVDSDTIKYDSVIDDLNSFMTTVQEAKYLEASPSNRNINAVHPKEKKHNKNSGPLQHNDKSRGAQQKGQNSVRTCWRCGGEHHPDSCKHKAIKCRKCNFPGHLDRICEKVQEWRQSRKRSSNYKNPNMRHLLLGSASLQDSSLLKLKVILNGKPVIFNLDTGAEANLINESTYALIGKPPIRKCKEQGRMFDGTLKSFIGKGKSTFEFKGIKIDADFYVAAKGSLNLLSLQVMDKFGLLDELKKQINIAAVKPTLDAKKFVDEIKNEFTDLFKNELGHCTKVKAHLTLKDGAQPIYRRARPVPYNSREVIDCELDRLENLKVIERVEHSAWAAPILAVKKSDTGLNEALQDHSHPLPVPEDIFATLNGGKCFSQIDLRDAYFQIELDEESQKICAIATHRGNFIVKRLPFGVKTAPALFQSVMDAMLAGLSFATAYLDDIIIVSRSIEEHSKHLKEVFDRLKNYGFRIKIEKCSFFKESITYLGLIIDKNGRKPDPSKIHAITKMPHPTDIPSLRSYLGMVNHYQQFVRNMRFIRKPLVDLLKKENKWAWDEKCDQAFNRIKDILASELMLTHYDPKLDIIVSADASELGIGAVIAHRFPDGTIKPIAHASSSLTPAEKNYSQIEKEGLALIFAVQKFHKMIYGRHFVLQTDHKPLLSIFGSKKGVKQCSANRLLRWSLILLAYDFTIEYVNTLEFGQADVLSRLIANGDKGENERVIAAMGVDLEMNSILSEAVQPLPIKFSDIVKATEMHQTLLKVKNFIQKGWPEGKKLDAMEGKIKLFHRRKSELSIINGCLMFADRVVIPECHQRKILKSLHKGHPGIKRMKQLARKYVYWPNVDSDIEKFVQGCEPCQLAAKAPVKTELHSWPKTTQPWQRVHMDYAGPYFGKDFLIVVDAHSKYPEVFEMGSISAAATIKKIRYLFSRHGICETLVSDNGTQFKSCEFAQFAKANGINHLFSAPYNPMSNGQAERFVDIFKRTFGKLKGEGTPGMEIIEIFLTTYRTTPNDALPDSKSPAEVFLGRKPRTTLDLLRPPPVQPIVRNEQMEKNFNKRFGTKLRTFRLGEKVFARHRISQTWKAGIISKCTGVIYDVKFVDTSVGRFHANQLRQRHTANVAEDHLDIFNEAFNLPKPPNAQQVVEENELVPLENNEEPGNGIENGIAQDNANAGPGRKNPPRNRGPPKRFSPPC